MDRQISLLIPSRGRPERLLQMIASAFATSTKSFTFSSLQFCIGLDKDDSAYSTYEKLLEEASITLNIAYHISDKQMSAPDHLNAMAKTIASGELMFALGDDVLFRTENWNKEINLLWDKCPDNILIAYCNNGRDGEKCEHFILHSDWIRQTIDICPPYFRHFCVDGWVEDIAIRINRLTWLKHVIVEHMHFKYGKAQNDDTYQAVRQPIGSTSVSEIDTAMYRKTDIERIKIANKLRAYIDDWAVYNDREPRSY